MGGIHHFCCPEFGAVNLWTQALPVAFGNLI
jgi:hypothetical protein